MDIILASKSPRRRELLTMLGLDFTVIPAVGDERTDPEAEPGEMVMSLALGKAEEVASSNPECLVIGADTLVFLDGKPLGKPSDEAEALEMLRSLSGRTHQVYTGIAVIYKDRTIADFEKTDVEFRELSDSEILRYIGTGEPMDKAGAYGIQGRGSVFIPGIRGDYFNVMGLPLCRLWSVLREIEGV
ncbi:MAG: septum formation inhibitor Maf [Oscillospiraceae bacterium]|nr:septum formation inhibitor Maf [Oscillospiraceae bacterium]